MARMAQRGLGLSRAALLLALLAGARTRMLFMLTGGLALRWLPRGQFECGASPLPL